MVWGWVPRVLESPFLEVSIIELLVPPEKGRTKIINEIFSCIHWSLQSYNVALLMFGTLGMTATLQYLRNYMISPLDVSRSAEKC